MKRFFSIIKAIEPLNIWNALANFISITCAISAWVGGLRVLGFIAVLFFFIGFLLLLLSIKNVYNKEKTLQLLVKNNRIMTVRLLLTYELYKNSPANVTGNFQKTELKVENAIYSYKIVRSRDVPGKYDLQCSFEFILSKQKQKFKDFNIMILQPRGKNQPKFNYTWVSDKEQDYSIPASMKSIVFDENVGVGFSGIISGKISEPELTENIKSLKVNFNLIGAPRPAEKGAFLVFPFLYAKSLHKCEFYLDYSEIDPSLFPSSVSVDMASYDGNKAIVGKIKDLQCNSERNLWTGQLHGSKCRAQAVYIIETHPNKDQNKVH